MLEFYVYAYLRNDGSPYYIGKGCGNRAYTKSRHEIKPPANTDHIVVVENQLSEIGALAIERRMIRWYGRKDIGTGILRNKTDGGDGASGLKHSSESKALMSVNRSGKGLGPQTSEHVINKANALRGKKHTEERRKKNSLSKLGKPHIVPRNIKTKFCKGNVPWNFGKSVPRSIESIQKQKESAKGMNSGPQKIVECPHCSKTGGASNMARYHFDKCKSMEKI